MSQWQILVLGVLRLGLNADYDRIQELANEHKTLRQMLGHSDWSDVKQYNLQTLKDNLRLFTPEILDRINQEVVRAGHQALKKNPAEGVVGSCDSFVVETDVHFPTDINLPGQWFAANIALKTGQGVYRKPCRIGVEAGNPTPDVFPIKISGGMVKRTTPGCARSRLELR